MTRVSRSPGRRTPLPVLRCAVQGLVLAASLAVPAWAQPGCTSDAMIVFDGSGSMAEMGFNRLDRPRIIEAREAVRLVAPRVAPLRRIGLMVYGPGPQSCSQVDLRFAPMHRAAERLVAEIDALDPEGETPLTLAVTEAARMFAPGRAGVIVVVTDGGETCGGAPCRLAAELAARGDVTVHVIGFKLRGAHFTWQSEGRLLEDYENGSTVAQCLAERTGGLYVSAETVAELVSALQRTLGCAVVGSAGPTRPRLR